MWHTDNQSVYIAGTTHQYLECHTALQPRCASTHPNRYQTSKDLNTTAEKAGTTICGAAGIHPFYTGSGANASWDAVVTLHVQKSPQCDGISGWSVIVHAHPDDSQTSSTPPSSWTGDQILVGSFSEDVDANYDGKYFQTPAGELYLVYQKQKSANPKRDGVVALPMDSPTTPKPGTNATFLLLPDEDLNSENYISGNDSFKLIETGNIRAINGKFIMAYSVGAYDHQTYKMGVAYSDTFLPAEGEQYRKVMKENPKNLWNSKGEKEVWYLLQAEEQTDGWRYVGDQVLAPGVPTVAQIGADDAWVALFAGYDPKDAPVKDGTNRYEANHRRPFFVDLRVDVPENGTVKGVSDEELQSWITPVHG